jgi:hypothetical protein
LFETCFCLTCCFALLCFFLFSCTMMTHTPLYSNALYTCYHGRLHRITAHVLT